VRSGGELCVATTTQVAGDLLGGAVHPEDLLELARRSLSSSESLVQPVAVDVAGAAGHALGVAPQVTVLAHQGLDVPPELWEFLAASSPVVLAVALESASQTTVFTADGGSGPLSVRSDLRDTVEQLLTLRFESRRIAAHDGCQVALEAFYPTPKVLLAGWVALGRVIADLARQAGWSCITTPSTDEAVELARDLTPRDAVIVLGHDPTLDEPVLAASLRPNGPGFVGALGSASVVEDRRRRLAAIGIGQEELGRLQSPVGLPIGGRTPAQMAIAIVAQLQGSRYRD
jgi:xanthine dehydrogenase accessory factor